MPRKSKIQRLQEQVQLQELQLRQKMLEATASLYDGPKLPGKLVRQDTTEDGFYPLDNFVDPATPYLDTPDFFPLGAPFRLPININHQNRGEFLPVFLDWMMLKWYRDISRRICAYNPFACNALENRVSYIVGKGYKYQIVGKKHKNPEPSLIQQAQAVLDEFCDKHDWPAKEQEIVYRTDRDGETFLRFFDIGHGRCDVRFVEPEYVQSTDNPADTTFGVITDPDDIQNVLAYMVVENPQEGWSPVRVDADQVIHFKLNTDSAAKRGLPTLFPVTAGLSRAEKLLRNMSLLAQVQATFAVIRKHRGGSSSAVQAFQQANTDWSYQDPITGNTKSTQLLQPGSIVDSSANTDWEFPGASVDASGYVEVLQAELRAIASRLCMPEYMLSSDASNANFACHDAATTLLTRRGWLRYDELKATDLAATMNPKTGGFEWQMIQKVHIHDYNGELVHLEGRDFDVAVTPNHRMYVARDQSRRIDGKMVRTGLKPYTFARADAVRRADVLPLSVQGHDAERVETFTIPGVQHNRKRKLHPQPKTVAMDVFLRFLGWWVSEGWTCNDRSRYHAAVCQTAHQSSECQDIRQTLKALPYNVREYEDKTGRITWDICDKSLFTWLRENCGTNSHTKRLPDFVFDLPAEQQAILLDAMLLGDGSHRKSGSASYFTTSRVLADHVQAIALQCGYVVNECKPMLHGWSKKYVVSVRKPGRKIRLADRHIQKMHYTGKVWCVSVDNGLIITRRNGNAIVAGNSTMVAESPAVKNFERLQQFYARHFGAGVFYPNEHNGVMWRVLQIAVESGRLPPEVLTDLEIQATPPSTVVRNKLEEAQRNQILHQNGVLSTRAWAEHDGLDYEQQSAPSVEPDKLLALQTAYFAGQIERSAAIANAKASWHLGDRMLEMLFPPKPQKPARPPSPPAGQPAPESLREDSYFANCKRDEHGHCTSGGGGSDHPGHRKDKQQHDSKPVSKSHDAKAVVKKLAPEIKELKATPQGRALLKRGKELASKAKEGLHAAISKGLEALDSKGGVSLIFHGVTKLDAGAMAAGAGILFSSVFEDVHEEVFENALSQHSLPGAHAIGVVAAGAAAKAEGVMLKAVAWSLAQTKLALVGHEAEMEFNFTDEAIQMAATAARNTLKALYKEAGVNAPLPSTKEMTKRLKARLEDE